jgi:hypothetical protein
LERVVEKPAAKADRFKAFIQGLRASAPFGRGFAARISF